MTGIDEWKKRLGLKPHPEGGYYKETYRSEGKFGNRSYCTSIYFLLPSTERSLFHRIKSDELWYYHAGSSLTIFVLDGNRVQTFKVGTNAENGESLHVMIPAGKWFGAMVDQPNSYTLCSCSVSPGFDFNDFELAEREALLKEFPDCTGVINKLTR